MASRAWDSRCRFFLWRPVSIVLIILTTLYGMATCLNLWMGSYFSKRGELHLAHSLYWGAFWDAVVAFLCFFGRQMMARQTRMHFLAGAIAVSGAVFIFFRVWAGEHHFPRNESLLIFLIEAVLILLPMLYCITYAVRESKREDAV
jgi:hypothetical protein